MRKKTLVKLYILANALFILELVVLILILLYTSSSSHCKTVNCNIPHSVQNEPLVVIGTILFGGCALASFILGGIVVIATLIKEAKYQRWAWFICTL
jgi:hypothetical protein